MTCSFQNRKRNSVPGISVGQIVLSCAGSREFRVLANDEYVTYLDGQREGPYCRLQALDDKSINVIYPRAWYWTRGDNLELFQ